ncbi:protein FAR-RED ELONGATED HYPOCOTYL 3-like isoform X1 [Euphorbia lathyris]|uniref:protein FAR-RED ELONGATED HYPOCOTYL 3-like isoform X1 n=1 Tax=Euphorbia lathyris TaxID=212925 RepID=UPI003313797E
MSGLSIASKLIVRDMSSAQAKPCAILAVVKEKHPKDNPTIKHVYNYRDKMRKDGFEGRDLASQFYHIALENKYAHYTQTEGDSSVITHVFMAHSESVDLFRTYHWYIGIDSTYKTNKYKMPFVEIIGMTPCNNNFKIAYAIIKDETEGSYRWVLHWLRVLIGFDLNPTVIVSDRELGLLKPILEVFPHTAHLLCIWHINKDVEDRAYKIMGDKSIAGKFKNGKWRTLIESLSIAEYEENLGKMQDSMSRYQTLISYVEETWLVHKEKFVVAWMKNFLHFGNTTTSRVESEHASLKQWLNTATGSLDTVWQKVHKQIEA